MPRRKLTEAERKERRKASTAKYRASLKGRWAYQRSKSGTLASTKLRYERNKAALSDYKANTPCKDCGGLFHPAAMDFDHLPGVQKLRCVGAMVTGPAEAMWAEAAKCDLVCSNCHRVRTWLRNDPTRRDPRRGLSEIN